MGTSKKHGILNLTEGIQRSSFLDAGYRQGELATGKEEWGPRGPGTATHHQIRKSDHCGTSEDILPLSNPQKFFR